MRQRLQKEASFMLASEMLPEPLDIEPLALAEQMQREHALLRMIEEMEQHRRSTRLPLKTELQSAVLVSCSRSRSLMN